MNLNARASSAKPVLDISRLSGHLRCPLCSGLLVNCFQTRHGIRLCEACMLAKLHPKKLRPFPVPASTHDTYQSALISLDENERLVSQNTCLPDLATRRELSRLTVRCPHADLGCDFQLEWKDVLYHLDRSCDFEFTQCHLCSERVVLYQLNTSHLNLLAEHCCPVYDAAECPLCGDTSQRLTSAAFALHLSTCPAKETHCKYPDCPGAMPRSQLASHYSSNIDGHLELAVRQLKTENETQEQKFMAINQRLDQHNDGMEASYRQLRMEMDAMGKRQLLLETENRELRKQLQQLRKTQFQAPRLGHSRCPSAAEVSQPPLGQRLTSSGSTTAIDREEPLVARGANDLNPAEPQGESKSEESDGDSEIIRQSQLGWHRRTLSCPTRMILTPWATCSGQFEVISETDK